MVEKLFEQIYQNADYAALDRLLSFRSAYRAVGSGRFDVLSISPDSVRPLSQNGTEKKRFYAYHPVKLRTAIGSVVTVAGLSFQGEFDKSRYMQYSCTDITDEPAVNLVQLCDGSIKLISVHERVKQNELIAVLQFSPSDCGLSFIRPVPEPITVAGIDCVNFEKAGFCRDSAELRFVPPIPEGVENLEEAFMGCEKFNCPIFLPSTIKNCKDMLKGCRSFRSKIYLPSNLQIDDVIGLKEYTQFVEQGGAKNAAD